MRLRPGVVGLAGRPGVIMANKQNIKVGDFYEDCRYHPMLCIEITESEIDDVDDDALRGISLVTGQVGNCSAAHCGVVKLTAEEAIKIRLEGPTLRFNPGQNVDDLFPGDKKWWKK